MGAEPFNSWPFVAGARGSVVAAGFVFAFGFVSPLLCEFIFFSTAKRKRNQKKGPPHFAENPLTLAIFYGPVRFGVPPQANLVCTSMCNQPEK